MNESNLLSECKHLDLPVVKRIRIRNELDRFGFSYVLANIFDISKPPRSFCCYMHGWFWVKDFRLEDSHYYSTPKTTTIIVATEYQKKIFIKYGFTNVVAGGLPFAYVRKSNAIRKARSLLIVPPHSLRYYNLTAINNDLLDFFVAEKNKFSEISFCLHADDANNEEVTSMLRKRDINYIVGAHAEDANSLYRMRKIFDYYDYVTTTVMGSHILYASYCGCRVSMLRSHQFFYPRHTANMIEKMKSVSGFADRFLDIFNNTEKLELQFPWLFVDHPINAVQMIHWANEEIGSSNLLSKDFLMNVLGWTIKAKLRALKNIALNRLINLFN